MAGASSVVRQLSRLRIRGLGVPTVRQLASASPKPTVPQEEPENPGSQNEDMTPKTAAGGFVRGLFGGTDTAAEDEYRAVAKEAGVELPRNQSLVPTRKPKKKRTDSEEQGIRDRIFGRFSGSKFMEGASNAQERFKERIDEADNPVINFGRRLYDRIFAENENAQVIGAIQAGDPTFRISDFLAQMEHELIPRILKAYLTADLDTLKSECTGESLSVLKASINERKAGGFVLDPDILAVEDIQFTNGTFLDDNPVLIVQFAAQQINCVRNLKGEIIEGNDDDIRAVYYAWAMCREIEFEDDRPTGGGMGDNEENQGKAGGDDLVKPWKLMEMAIRGAHSVI